MIISGESVESYDQITGVLDNPDVKPMLGEWAESYHFTDQAVAATGVVEDMMGLPTPSEPGRKLSGEEIVRGMFGEAYVSAAHATTLAKGMAHSRVKYLGNIINGCLARERADLEPNSPDWVQNHLTRLALKSAFRDLKPKSWENAPESPTEVVARYRGKAFHTLAGLDLLNEAMRESAGEDLLVVHLNNHRARCVAGRAPSEGLSNLGRLNHNISLPLEGGVGPIGATYSIEGGAEIYNRRPKQLGHLDIPVEDLAPVVQMSADELNTEGLFGPGDFEGNRFPFPNTVVVTNPGEISIHPDRSNMFERREAVVSLAHAAQRALA